MKEKTQQKPKKNKFLITFVCIFLSALVAFGGTFAVIHIVRERNSVAKYNGVYLDEGATRYLASYYKLQYLQLLRGEGVTAYDSELFWESEAEGGKTYGELLSESFVEYISSLLVAVSIYEEFASYDKSEEERVEYRTGLILEKSIADGSVDKFNKFSEPLGFSYEDFLSAAEYLYKASVANALLYGTDGSGVSADSAACNEYLSSYYSRVSLLFISLDRVYVRDTEGNFTYDDDGEAVTRALTAAERAEREEMVAKLRGYIAGEGGTITPETFEYYLEKSDVPESMYEQGYYFNEGSATTEEFAEVFPEIVEAALDMEIGEYREAAAEEIGGVCFIYKHEVKSGAYLDKENVFFSDFYRFAADYAYLSLLSELAPEVTLTENFQKIDIVNGSKKIRDDFVVRGW